MTAGQLGHSVGPSIYGTNQIGAAVVRLADEIAADHRGKPLTLIGVLKGALCFTVDLARELSRRRDGPSELFVDYVCVERYGFGGVRGREPRLAMDAGLPLAGANVVILDGIVDRGQTLAFLRALIESRNPASMATGVLFEKRANREVEVEINYVGLAVPNLFAIGYGLDYQELYRNLPCLAELREGQTV
ncbi:MAG TPA: phosphoribosyltransferase family protein [Candidatus Cybelea sp.]|jgi:hypoxanthine phosphoribosyltransferase|nr:phosphoribosyltransferase family protein [Candidatus Cybelea sp.]